MNNKAIRTMKWAAAVVASTVITIACQKDASSTANNGGTVVTTAPTRVKVYLTDDQTLVFDKVNIDIQKLEIKLEDDGVDSLGGWFNLNITPGVYDILQFRNAAVLLVSTEGQGHYASSSCYAEEQCHGCHAVSIFFLEAAD